MSCTVSTTSLTASGHPLCRLNRFLHTFFPVQPAHQSDEPRVRPHCCAHLRLLAHTTKIPRDSQELWKCGVGLFSDFSFFFFLFSSFCLFFYQFIPALETLTTAIAKSAIAWGAVKRGKTRLEQRDPTMREVRRLSLPGTSS